MKTKTGLYLAAAGIAALLAACAAQMGSQGGEAGVTVGGSDLGGVVSGSSGPDE